MSETRIRGPGVAYTGLRIESESEGREWGWELVGCAERDSEIQRGVGRETDGTDMRPQCLLYLARWLAGSRLTENVQSEYPYSVRGSY